MDVLTRIKELAAADFSVDSAKIDPATPLTSLQLDSLTFIEFLYKVEDEFGVSMSDEQVKDIKCLGDLERYVLNALAAKTLS